jgi:hypothetical protein
VCVKPHPTPIGITSDGRTLIVGCHEGRTNQSTQARFEGFAVVKELGCALPNVETTTKYDGSPLLKAHGVFMAGIAMHASAEPDTLVVRAEFADRVGLLADAPETYYVTNYYRPHPVVLVRLSHLNRDVLRELLAGWWRMTVEKRRKAAR